MELRVLSEKDMTFFEDNGYLVVPNAVPQENLDALISAIFEYLEMDANDPSTWYPAERKSALVHFHQHPALWANRQYPKVHDIFTDLLGTEKLWVSLDRAGMKPPVNPDHPLGDDNGFIHWDLDTTKPLPTRPFVQGVLSLTDTDADMGGFQCIPGFHKNLDQWLDAYPEARPARSPKSFPLPEGMAITPIPMKAGDLVIWNSLLAHGNGRNEGTRPRLAQYLTMHRVPENFEEGVADRIASFEEKRATLSWEREVPEPYKGSERKYPHAELTPLGRKLLGMDTW